ncbi:MAG: anaerobic ribonucleoside-triphosphate reductase activating protein [Lachnospiraceae bacterium]|jgi:anaerobic ribonucleoside-triphosphate reductase activating protein|nr:anaerobic ribonucleoside-triphosphate reductase activating protein [Lachnospiraceae bacterium]
MYYSMIKKHDIADGPGVRVSLFVSGCTNRCQGCFQPETWDFHYGSPYTKETEEEILEALAPSYIQGLTLLGGEPFEAENQRELTGLLRAVKERYPGKDIWCYTGFTMDRDLIPGGCRHCEVTDEFLGHLDVLVDGRFVQEKRNLMLAFRGSENQRIIDVKASRDRGEIVLSGLQGEGGRG